MTPWLDYQRPLVWVFQFWPALFLSVTTSVLATLLCRKLAMRLGIVDKPDNLVKTHKEPVAYLGGVAILFGILAGILAGIFCVTEALSQMSVFWLIMLTGGALTACAVGLADDILDLSPKHKLVGQILAATFLVSAGIRPHVAWFGESAPDMVHWVLNSILVYVFVLGATNSLNLLDGLDGLCAGVTGIMTVGLLVLSVLWAMTGVSETDDPIRLIMCLALLGSVLGFLPFNRHPARIFMGDAGSLLLGFFVAVIMIFFAKSAQGCLVVLMIFGLPLLDTSVSLTRRWLNRKPLFESDRGHVYDQIMDRGQSQQKTVALCYSLCLLFVLIGLFMSLLHVVYGGLLACLVLVLSGVVVWRKGFLEMKGLRGAIQKSD